MLQGADKRSSRFTDVVTYDAYDGRSIILNNGAQLVPDGWIEYPSTKEKQLFDHGEPLKTVKMDDHS